MNQASDKLAVTVTVPYVLEKKVEEIVRYNIVSSYSKSQGDPFSNSSYTNKYTFNCTDAASHKIYSKMLNAGVPFDLLSRNTSATNHPNTMHEVRYTDKGHLISRTQGHRELHSSIDYGELLSMINTCSPKKIKRIAYKQLCNNYALDLNRHWEEQVEYGERFVLLAMITRPPQMRRTPQHMVPKAIRIAWLQMK